MKITTKHRQSKHGNPVILSDSGKVMPHPAGIVSVRRRLNMSVAEVAKLCGVSARTVEGWEGGRPVPASAMNALGDELNASAMAPPPQRLPSTKDFPSG